MDLFSQNFEAQQKAGAPLAEKMRPTTLDEVGCIFISCGNIFALTKGIELS